MRVGRLDIRKSEFTVLAEAFARMKVLKECNDQDFILTATSSSGEETEFWFGDDGMLITFIAARDRK